MEAKTFNFWLKNTVVLWQGEPSAPAWEVTDGEDSVQIDLTEGYRVTYTDIVMGEEEIEIVFDLVGTYEAERLDDLNANYEDDLELGLYGYGY